jgi:alpha-glucosidase
LTKDDVADYRDVDPNIGTLRDFDEMISAFKQADIKIIVDIVPNHCSDTHPWFREALRSEKGSASRARFHFLDGV